MIQKLGAAVGQRLEYATFHFICFLGKLTQSTELHSVSNEVMVSTIRFILLLIIAVTSAFYVYLITFHRVIGFDDIRSVVKVAQSPNINSRCKLHNATHYYCLPNVLFIGASKCGTTSMVEYLSKHPNIRFVNRRIHKKDHHREVHRFDRNSFGLAIKSIDLLDEWASSPLLDSINTTLIHYTPHYLYAPTVPYDVRQFYPHASELKFIVMLRDPVERALSSYWFQNSHLLNGGIDSGSMDEFMSLASAEINDRYDGKVLRMKNCKVFD